MTGLVHTVMEQYRAAHAVLLVAFLVLLVIPASAAEITINPGTANIINTTIAGAGDGDTIILNPGTYNEDNIVAGKSITLRANTSAGHGASDTIIDGNLNGTRIFTVSGSYSFSLHNLTLRNGTAPGYGGGIYSIGSTVNITNSTFFNCSVTAGDGGGIYAAGGAVNITGSAFTNCSASTFGGAVFASTDATNTTIVSSTFTDCSAAQGGAISNSATATITSTTFTNCSATGYGGAIMSNNNITVTSSTFTGCTAPSGGAISNSRTLTITSSTFSSCSATTNGGALYLTGGTNGTITSTKITGCSAKNGGAIHSTLSGTSGPLNITSTTISGCSATANGGAIVSSMSGTSAALNIMSTTITGCSATNGGAIYVMNAGSGNFVANTSAITGCSATSGGAVWFRGVSTGIAIVHFSRIYDNTATTGPAVYRFAGTVNATDTWWGSNADPSGSFSGTVMYSPWLVLGATADPIAITTGQTSRIRANLTFNSTGSDTSAEGLVPDGIPVAFAVTSGNGSVMPAAGNISAGANATVFFPAGTGLATVNATVDGASVGVLINVTPVASPESSGESSTADAADPGRSGSYAVQSPGAAAGQTMTFSVDESLTPECPWAIITVALVTAETLGPTDLLVTDVPEGEMSPFEGRDLAGIVSIQPVSVNPSSIDRATIVFAVAGSWLRANGLAAEDIVLMHLSEGKWTELATTFDRQDGDMFYFSATTPDFSYFAVASRKNSTAANTTLVQITSAGSPVNTGAESMGSSTEYEAPTVHATNPVATRTPAVPENAPAPDRSSGIPLLTVAVAITGIVIVVIGGIFIRRWWIRRQNPALFRKYD